MKNYFIHITIWAIGIIISTIMALYGNGVDYNIAIVWVLCAIYFVLYYITRTVKFIRTDTSRITIGKSGIFSGRAFGIFINMFVLQYVMELYKNIFMCMVFVVCSIVILFLLRKDIKNFFTKNEWKFSYYEIYIAFTLLLSSILSIIGFYRRDLLMVDVSQVGISVKILLMFTYGIITLISVIPDSFVMKVATINDENKYN